MEIIADGHWHSVEDVIREAMRYVPPARAYREGERIRVRLGGPEERTRGGRQQSILSGQRSIARSAIRNGPWMELSGEGDHQMVRMRKMELKTETIARVRSCVQDAVQLLTKMDDPTHADLMAVLGTLQEVNEIPPFAWDPPADTSEVDDEEYDDDGSF